MNDTATNTVTATIGLPDNPERIAISGTTAYLTIGNGEVAVIDTTTNTVTGTIALGQR